MSAISLFRRQLTPDAAMDEQRNRRYFSKLVREEAVARSHLAHLQRKARLTAPGGGRELLKRQIMRAEGLVTHLKAKHAEWIAKHGTDHEG